MVSATSAKEHQARFAQAFDEHESKNSGEAGEDWQRANAPEFINNWIYIAGIKRFYDLILDSEYDDHQFSAMWAPFFEKGSAHQHVLRNPNFRRVHGVTYAPQQPRFVVEDGLEKLNTWKDPKTPAVDGNADPFLQHVEYMFPGPEKDILLDFFAFLVQHPGEKVHWALVMESHAEGIGKSIMVDAIRTILGFHNVRSINSDTLKENFTGWKKNAQLIVVEEVMTGGRIEIMNKLKPMITDTVSVVREMNKPEYQQPNRINFVLMSNHDNALILNDTDRRYCVLKSEATPRSRDYYKDLVDWITTNIPAIHYMLKTRDLSNFYPKGHAPMTEGKRLMIEASMLPLDQWIEESISMKEGPFKADVVSVADVARECYKFGLKATPKEVGKSLARLGCYNYGQQRDKADRVRLWTVRDHEKYKRMSGSELRAIWNEQRISAERSAAQTSETNAPRASQPRRSNFDGWKHGDEDED